jgi:hypothetical protein
MILQLQLMLKQHRQNNSFLALVLPSDYGQWWPKHAKVNVLLTSVKLITLNGLLLRIRVERDCLEVG